MHPPRPLHALLLDLGNVVFKVSFEAAFAAWYGTSRVPVEPPIPGLLRLPCFSDFETGEIGASAFHAAASAYLELDIGEADFFRGWNSIYGDPVPGIDLVLDALKRRGIPVYGFTNTNAAHSEIWKRKYRSQLAGFERIFESQVIRLRKPDPQAFRHVTAEMRLREQDILFVDDMRENVEAALGVGMQAVWLPPGAELRRELALKGILA
jgi:glucose-1-phosphatase